MVKTFKEKNTFEVRKNESSRINSKYMAHIPVICEKSKKTKLNIDKTKFLVPSDFTLGQFMYVVRKRLLLPPEKAIFLFINNTIPQASKLMSDIYIESKDKDGFLYVIYSTENTFG